jgi:hypothetical protein
MKPYFVGMGFIPILIFAHFFMPPWFFMIVAFSMLFFFCQMAANHKEPVFEWPELSFSQNDKTIILTMSTKDGKSIDRYLSINRLNLPKTVVEKTVEKTTSSIWHVLGMMPTTDRNAVEKAFRKMSMVYHPDTGGTTSAFNALVEAKEKALQKCR